MKLALTHRQRAALLVISASGYTAWFAGHASRGAAAGGAPVLLTPEPISANGRVGTNVARIITRDPFSGAPAPHTEGARADASLGPIDSADGVNVPDLTAAASRIASAEASPATAAAGAQDTYILKATIVGPRPVAYVAAGTEMFLLRIDDRLGGHRVVGIDARGIAFDDGTRLELDSGDVRPAPIASPPRPTRSNVSTGISLDELRRLLDERLRPVPTPSPSASAPPPTPAPLPTVDRRGIEPGVNPTPDYAGPTAFPNPYPYAPPAVLPRPGSPR